MRLRSLIEGEGPLEPLACAARRLLDEPLPKGVGWSRVFGSVLLFLLAVQFGTGTLLAVYYSPSSESAWESVRFIETQVLFGSLIRGIHHWAASAFIVVLALHLAQVFLSAGFKRPRQATWTVGVLLLVVGLGFGYTGYLLPWDLRAYFGTKVGTEIPGSVPVVGPFVMRLLRGGEEVSALTLARFFALHAIALPLGTVALVSAHLFLVRRYGIAPAGTRVGETPAFSGRFFPAQFVRDSVAVILAGTVVVSLARFLGAPLEGKADPHLTAYVPSPDWYFLGLQQLLRIFTGQAEILGTFVLPAVGVALLFLVPFLDRSRERAPVRRPAAILCGVLAAVVIVALTAGGAVSVRRERAALERREGSGGISPDESPLEISNPAVISGMNVVTSLRCQGCHSFGNVGRDDVPPFGFEGSRVRREWLYEYLRQPYPIRWKSPHLRLPVRMPEFHLSEAEVATAAEYLLTQTDESVVPPEALPALARDASAALRGAGLFRALKCNGCHQAGDEGEEVGPDLTLAGRRLRPGFMAAMIRAPQSVVPGTEMKVQPLGDREIADLVAYLERLR